MEYDSQSVIFLPKNQTSHLKTNNIDVQYHFVREMVENEKVLLEKVDIVENVADLLAKSIRIENFTWCRSEIGFIALSNLMVISVSCETFKGKNKW